MYEKFLVTPKLASGGVIKIRLDQSFLNFIAVISWELKTAAWLKSCNYLRTGTRNSGVYCMAFLILLSGHD